MIQLSPDAALGMVLGLGLSIFAAANLGVATATRTAPSTKGSYKMTVAFAGSTAYAASSVTVNIRAA